MSVDPVIADIRQSSAPSSSDLGKEKRERNHRHSAVLPGFYVRLWIQYSERAQKTAPRLTSLWWRKTFGPGRRAQGATVSTSARWMTPSAPSDDRTPTGEFKEEKDMGQWPGDAANQPAHPDVDGPQPDSTPDHEPRPPGPSSTGSLMRSNGCLEEFWIENPSPDSGTGNSPCCREADMSTPSRYPDDHPDVIKPQGGHRRSENEAGEAKQRGWQRHRLQPNRRMLPNHGKFASPSPGASVRQLISQDPRIRSA